MKHGVAKRALGVVMASAMVATTMGNVPGVEWKGAQVAKAAGGDALYVTSTDYYNAKYDEEHAYNGSDLGCTYTKDKTTFKVWSPEANKMKLTLYKTGSDKEEGAGKIDTIDMTK